MFFKKDLCSGKNTRIRNYADEENCIFTERSCKRFQWRIIHTFKVYYKIYIKNLIYNKNHKESNDTLFCLLINYRKWKTVENVSKQHNGANTLNSISQHFTGLSFRSLTCSGFEPFLSIKHNSGFSILRMKLPSIRCHTSGVKERTTHNQVQSLFVIGHITNLTYETTIKNKDTFSIQIHTITGTDGWLVDR